MPQRKVKAAECGPAWKGRLEANTVRELDLETVEGRRELVCAGFCTFYREGTVEAGQCAGLRVVARVVTGLLRQEPGRRRLMDALRLVQDSGRPVDYRWDRLLEVLMCGECPFLPDGGCDHRNPELAPEQRLEPCGGYVLLAALFSLRPPRSWGVEEPGVLQGEGGLGQPTGGS